MIGVAFEVHDSEKTRSNPKSEDTSNRPVNPALIDLFHYAFNHAGILTGPYYKYRTFHDLYNEPYTLYADCDANMWGRMVGLPIYIVLFLVTGYIFPLKVLCMASLVTKFGFFQMFLFPGCGG